MRSITLVIIAVLAGCTSEKVYHTQTSTEVSIRTSKPTGLAVLLHKSARIDGRELIWSCVYQTGEGQVVVEQREQCEPAM